jgi:hypothetical protein
VVDVEALRNARPLVELVSSSRSLDGPLTTRSDAAILISLGLLSARGLSLPSGSAVHDFLLGSYFGMRLMLVLRLEEMLLDNDGNDGAGDAEDGGCETQSSDNESSHACSIAMQLLLLKVEVEVLGEIHRVSTILACLILIQDALFWRKIIGLLMELLGVIFPDIKL